ncbi:hypothetical protein CP532_3083 [Ophiocordyceps camponoti-leonardi (nom. inval.)]|nr:hypothetical protein CP532_3083 [Ophiocordyceps camponoti-leonardi (nom. inval.)]
MADHPSARFRPHHVKRHSIFAANKDDLLNRLAPATAVEALAAPAGALSACLDAAPSPDRDLALRAALFSRRVWDWLLELESWTWPAPLDQAFLNNIGLSAAEAARYANRVDQIGRDLDRLDVEEIKKHVLANHVLPLSRPTTPVTDSDLSSLSSASSFIKMDDLTAVVTTIVMQALPNLARLSALLRLWTIRLRVLREASPFLYALEDAEAHLASVMESHPNSRNDPHTNVAASVAEPARILDYMLDCLDGMPDTLPDVWIDRVEALERDYAEWVATCERNMSARAKHWSDGAVADDSAIASPGPTELRTSSWQADGPNDELETGRGLPRKDTLHRDKGGESLASTPESLSRVGRYHGEHHDSDAPPHCRFVPGDGALDDTSPLSGRAVEEDDDDDDDEHSGLPPLRMSDSHQSLNSQASTLIFSGFGGAMSSSPPDMSTSPAVRLEDADDSPLHRRGKTGADDLLFLKSPADESFADDFDDSMSVMEDGTGSSYTLRSEGGGAADDDQQLRQQISNIIDAIPAAKIKLASEPVNLNPPDLQLPRLRTAVSREGVRRSASNLSTVSSSRAATATPSFTLSPAKHCRPRHRRAHQEIKVYHLSRSTGEPPIKLFIRCVGEHGERVMVRVGGGWADLSEYLKAYASHHGRRSTKHASRVEICREVVSASTPTSHQSFFSSSPITRPGSAAAMTTMTTTTTMTAVDDLVSPATPFQVRKMRALEAAYSSYPTVGGSSSSSSRRRPWTPVGGGGLASSAPATREKEPSSADSMRSLRSSWFEDEDGSSFLGLAGPSGRKVEMTDENRAWVESVKEKVRIASGSASLLPATAAAMQSGRFGELGSVGSTRRLFPGGGGGGGAPGRRR